MSALYLNVLEPGLTALVGAAVPTGEAHVPHTDHFNFAPRGHSPVLLQVGRTDWLSSPADAERLLELIPAEGSQLVFYEAGHRLPPSFASDAAAWLETKLLPAPPAP